MTTLRQEIDNIKREQAIARKAWQIERLKNGILENTRKGERSYLLLFDKQDKEGLELSKQFLDENDMEYEIKDVDRLNLRLAVKIW